jgi:hypothetical protein
MQGRFLLGQNQLRVGRPTRSWRGREAGSPHGRVSSTVLKNLTDEPGELAVIAWMNDRDDFLEPG